MLSEVHLDPNSRVAPVFTPCPLANPHAGNSTKCKKISLLFCPFLQLEDKKAKFVLVVRNPKDALVSFYNFHKTNPLLRESFNAASFDEFFERAKGKFTSSIFIWNSFRRFQNFLDRKIKRIETRPEGKGGGSLWHMHLNIKLSYFFAHFVYQARYQKERRRGQGKRD